MSTATLEHQIIDIELDRLSHDFSDRTEGDQARVDALAENLRTMGQVTPIVVAPAADGSMKIIAGKRRFWAAKKIGWNTLKAVVMSVEESARPLVILADNVFRQDVHPIMRARIVRDLLEAKVYPTQKAIAEAIGVSQPTISEWLKLLEETPEVQEAVASGELTQAAVRKKGSGKKGRPSKKDKQKKTEAAKETVAEAKARTDATKWQSLPEDYMIGREGPVARAALEVITRGHSQDDCDVRLVLSFRYSDLKASPSAAVLRKVASFGEAELLGAIRNYRIAKGYEQP